MAWFLIKHKELLGLNAVRSISVFHDEGKASSKYYSPVLLFEISEVNDKYAAIAIHVVWEIGRHVRYHELVTLLYLAGKVCSLMNAYEQTMIFTKGCPCQGFDG